MGQQGIGPASELAQINRGFGSDASASVSDPARHPGLTASLRRARKRQPLAGRHRDERGTVGGKVAKPHRFSVP